MHPVLFDFGVFKVYAYGLMVALAFIISTYLIKLQAQRQNIPAEKILNLSIWVAVSGILGARILYVLQNSRFYLEYPSQILMLNRGGLSFYGGFILALACAVIFLTRERLPLLRTLDLIAPYLALAQAIGRIGCFLNGCCYGKPSSSVFSVYFPGEDFGRYPVQIYSSLSLLALFIILRIIQQKKQGQTDFLGQTLLFYCLFYSTFRFLIEFLRGDNRLVFANLTLHQLISLGIFLISGLLLWKRQKSFTLRSRA